MKFAGKVFFSAIAVIAVSLGLVGYLLVSSNFRTALDREISRAQDEHLLLRFAFETAAVNVPAQEEWLEDETIREIASQLDRGIQKRERIVRVSDENFGALYQSFQNALANDWLSRIDPNLRTHRVMPLGDKVYVQVACSIPVSGRTLYLESARDISALFEQRAQQFAVYRKWTLVLLVGGSLVMWGLSLWLTRPLRSLSVTTRRIASGQYHERARAGGDDEFGEFTNHFNAMADALEDKIHVLEDSARQQEAFVASFAHELKTPLTSIIGYADMLRGQQLDAATSFKAASYIFSEGKRLESLSLKLMEMIVLRRQTFETKSLNAAVLIEELAGVMAPMLKQNDLHLVWSAEDAVVEAEPDLLKTLLMNLVDNARKASQPGQTIWLSAKREGTGYVFSVVDEGAGMPEEELGRITEAFYMVDKSRARRQHGAGLGLALAAEIAKLHQAQLSFQSAVGQGTSVYLRMGMQRPLSWHGRRRRDAR